MPDKELERKLDEGLALLSAIRPPRRMCVVAFDDGAWRPDASIHAAPVAAP